MQARPFASGGMSAHPTRSAWDAASAEILASVLTRWNLTAGEVLPGGIAGSVLTVICDDGTSAVLKIGYPHEEAVAEAIGLQALAPALAPRLLRQDASGWAMLLQRVLPGTRMQDAGLETPDALRIGGKLLARVAAVGAIRGVPALSQIVHRYASVARSRRDAQQDRIVELGGKELVDAAVDELDLLAGGVPGTSFVHGDFNPGNLLSSSAGFVVVDPKPMVGDPCYDLWPLVSQLGTPFDATDPVAALADQLTIAADAAGLDPVRSTRWAFARSGVNVSWHLEDGDLELAARSVQETRVWAGVRKSLSTER